MKSLTKMMGLISANYSNQALEPLTKERSVASLPYGGRYRLVDFPLSNMVNSGIFTVGLITPYMYRSIMDHVGVGKEWALSRKAGGMFILPGSIYGLKNVKGKFLLRDIIQNRAYLDRGKSDLVVISGSNKVFNIDFEEVAEYHLSKKAEITLVCGEKNPEYTEDDFFIEVDDDDKVISAGEKSDNEHLSFLDAMIISRELLIKIIGWYETTGYRDLVDIIIENLNHLTVCTYRFKGFVGTTDNVKCYLKSSLALLYPEVRRELFKKERPIITKIQDSPPAKYGLYSNVKNSFISAGSIIEGSVENSVIFRGVTIGEGATVKNSIIMQSTVVNNDAVLDNVICDKYAVVRKGIRLYGRSEDPILIGKNQHV